MKAVGAAWQKYKKQHRSGELDGELEEVKGDARDHTQRVPKDVMSHMADFLTHSDRAALAQVNQHSSAVVKQHRPHQHEKKCYRKTQGGRKCVTNTSVSGPCGTYCKTYALNYFRHALDSMLSLSEGVVRSTRTLTNCYLAGWDDGLKFVYSWKSTTSHTKPGVWYHLGIERTTQEVRDSLLGRFQSAMAAARPIEFDFFVHSSSSSTGKQMKRIEKDFAAIDLPNLGMTYIYDAEFQHSLTFDMHFFEDDDFEEYVFDSEDDASDSEVNSVEDLA